MQTTSNQQNNYSHENLKIIPISTILNKYKLYIIGVILIILIIMIICIILFWNINNDSNNQNTFKSIIEIDKPFVL